MPQRVQLSRRRGWRMPPNTVKVDRSTPWGNPYHGTGSMTAEARAYVTSLFNEYLKRPEKAGKVAAIREQLRGKNLACWCPLDEPCHADVLLQIANDGAPTK